ncbi:hypothetical protein FIE12Z_13051 [Fusarium flagelliforme]|uniref:Uncharacterized protein n=1 Tax=Fusarium flagelliforme TaxID=2675880 RepID=A0A395M4C9_9HYPO|nr:hypothetical protein FIE12Z_13051 [Fusarium flagelliforme]
MIDATHEGPAMSEAETARVAKKHQDFKYPKGISIDFLFKATMGANAELAPYLAFKGILEMNSYVDIADGPGHYQRGFDNGLETNDQAEGTDLEFQNFITGMNEDLKQHLSGQTDGADVQANWRPNKPSPVDILNEDPNDYPHRFPTPAEVGGDIEKRIANTFSMEDLHHAILLLYQLICRCADHGLARLADVPDVAVSATAMVRLAEAANLEEFMLTEREIRSRKRERARELKELAREEGRLPDPSAVLPPDPDAPIPLAGLDTIEAAIDEMEPISAEGFRAEIRLLKEHHNQPDFDERWKRTQQTITNVDRFVPEGDVNAFLERQSQSNVVTDFLLDHPDQQEEMMRLSRFQYNLEHTLASIQPAQDQDLNEICRQYDITPWPDLKLYSDEDGRFVQSLKPHPVDEQEEEIMKLSRYQYKLEHTLASIQPVQDRPLNDICDENGITPWPELKLYSDDDGKFVKTAPSLCGLFGNHIYFFPP